MVAYRVAWEITRNPAIRVLYISSTANLATKQLTFIKDLLTSPIYTSYWPDMVHPEEGKRTKWTESEFSVDHPRRKAELIRDPTVFTAGLTTTITGLHCDIAVLDDVVIRENAYTEEGREKVRSQYSLLSSIEGTGGREWVVGTRYHPKDLYNDLLSMEVEQYDEDTNEIIGSDPLYETFERAVEERGDGTGQFLWPRQQRYDGKWFGFDQKELAKKRAQYLDKVQFYSQYYNRPSTQENATIKREWFSYYKPEYLKRQNGKWYFKDRRLNVFAAVDFAFSLAKRADYTAIAVVGVDSNSNYYVLEIDRFKSDQISEYFRHILELHTKWDFRKLRAEVTMAQQVIVTDLKNNYVSRHGLSLAIEDFRPNRQQGAKEERVEAVLQPRYANRQIWHYRGGNCQSLEDELTVTNPAHDDCKDALASCIEICVAPTLSQSSGPVAYGFDIIGHHRFGGIL